MSSVILSLLLLQVSRVCAQNLEEIGNTNPIGLNGGCSVNQILYMGDGGTIARKPYSYVASGNVALSLFGWSVPLSFTVSDNRTAFQQPFNQYSFHPTYKSFTAHIGYTSVSYSPYTVNGHVFLGGAIDFTPQGKWKFQALHGRFLKAVEGDSTNGNQSSSFKRMGSGLKATFTHNRDFIEVVIFHAKDIQSSITSFSAPLINPQQNLVGSITVGKPILKKFFLRTEYSSSALTHDLTSQEMRRDHLLTRTDFLFKNRTSTAIYNALKSSFDYQHEMFTLGIGYERVDPGYKTLGAYFFNNDLRNITLNIATSLLNRKVNVSVSAGRQHDNLNAHKISTMTRGVFSISANAMFFEKLNLSSTFSNFQTYTNIRSQFQQINELTPYDNIDTLDFTQISRSASLHASMNIGSEKSKSRLINMSLSLQDAAEQQGSLTNGETRFINLNTSYAHALPTTDMTVMLSLNLSKNEGQLNTDTYGPVLSVTKVSFGKKLRTTFGSAYNVSRTQGVKVTSIQNVRVSSTWVLKQKHNLNLSVVAVQRKRITSEDSSASIKELTATLGYSYTFSIRKQKDEKQSK